MSGATVADELLYESLSDEVRASLERLWRSRESNAYTRGYREGVEDGVNDERQRLYDELCPRCGSDVSACFACYREVR